MYQHVADFWTGRTLSARASGSGRSLRAKRDAGAPQLTDEQTSELEKASAARSMSSVQRTVGGVTELLHGRPSPPHARNSLPNATASQVLAEALSRTSFSNDTSDRDVLKQLLRDMPASQALHIAIT